MSETRPAAAPEEAPEVTTGYHLPQRTKMLILGGAMLAMFLSSMEQTVVSTSLPRIAADLNGLDLFAWVFTAFMLTSVTTIPVAGRLSDIYGRKPLLLVGLVVFLGGSALSGFAQDMTQLIGFRAVQGLGAGFLMANTMAISGDLFPPSERGKYMGVFAGIFGISALIGPPLGGFLTDSLSWRWVFWINLPLGVFSVIAIAMFMPWIRPAKRKVQIDYLGVILLALTLVPSLLALTLVGTSASLGDPLIVALFVGSALGLVAFMVVERRAAEPIVPLELFKNRTFRTVAIVMTGMGIGVFGVTFFLPLFVQGVIGKTATESGSIVTPQMLAVVVMAALAGQIMARTGRYKVMALVWAALLFGGLLTMTQLNASSTLGDVV
ncbi:MAG: MFS transporter, partial [Chloroflexi bacterium]|nr:MFS transporter [Chloroflexota bacterium]